MECAAGTDKIKVTPQGCKPVSVERCASGFMAPARNVTFPDDPLETCCKCKEGVKCPYCLGDECKDWEKKKYVTDKDCFELPPPVEEVQEEEEEDVVVEEEKESPLWKRYLWLILSIIGVIIFSLQIDIKIKVVAMVVYISGVALWVYFQNLSDSQKS